MSIELTPDNEAFTQKAVARGEYKDRAEAMNDAVRLMRERQRRLEELRDDVVEGMNAGPAVPATQVFDRLEPKAAQISQGASGPGTGKGLLGARVTTFLPDSRSCR